MLYNRTLARTDLRAESAGQVHRLKGCAAIKSVK